MSPKVTALARAKLAWGMDLPQWIERLARLCDLRSQTKVAKQIGYTDAVVSAVLNRKYKADLKTVEKRVRGAVMGETVVCPVMGGDLAVDLCMRHQARGVSTNPMHLTFYRACRNGCPNSQIESDDA